MQPLKTLEELSCGFVWINIEKLQRKCLFFFFPKVQPEPQNCNVGSIPLVIPSDSTETLLGFHPLNVNVFPTLLLHSSFRGLLFLLSIKNYLSTPSNHLPHFWQHQTTESLKCPPSGFQISPCWPCALYHWLSQVLLLPFPFFLLFHPAFLGSR